MKFTILGSGASMGVPLAGGDWGACDPHEKKNDRTRASLLVQSDTTSIIIDTTNDVRSQLNRVGLKKLDAIFLTHKHSDHVGGLDDLKHFSFAAKEPLGLYSDEETIDAIFKYKRYMFDGEFEIYFPFLKKKKINFYDSFDVDNIHVDTFEQDHNSCKTVGYRFGDVAYSVDVHNLDDRALEALKGVKYWIVDSCGYLYENVGTLTHAPKEYLDRWIDIIKPEMTYFTGLNNKMDYRHLCDILPPHIRPAYDGLVIESN